MVVVSVLVQGVRSGREHHSPSPRMAKDIFSQCCKTAIAEEYNRTIHYISELTISPRIHYRTQYVPNATKQSLQEGGDAFLSAGLY
jgi:hypothetical protein